MTQILPYVPNFLESLTPAIYQLSGAIGGAMGQRARKLEGLEELKAFGYGNKAEPSASPMQNATNSPASPSGASPMQNALKTPGAPIQKTLSPMDLVKLQSAAEKAHGKEYAKAFVDDIRERQKLSEKENIQIRKEQREVSRKEEENEAVRQEVAPALDRLELLSDASGLKLSFPEVS